MAPALSKFIHPVSVAIGVSVLFIGITGIVLYTISKRETVEVDEGEDQEDNEENGGEMQFSKLMGLLDSEDERVIINSLNKLRNLTAFKEFQVLVRKYGGLAKVSSFAKSASQDVKLQALNVINNLAMDVENQRFIKDLIPDLIALLCHEHSTPDVICLAVTRVLTNLTTVDDNHVFIIPHLFILLELLRISDFPIKLQVLKILVNISTNSHVTENEIEAVIQIIRVVGDIVERSFDEELLLRAVTCLANILSALRNRWQNRHKSHISTAEFVPESTEKRLSQLQLHRNEDIVLHAKRALAALQPTEGEDTTRTPGNDDLIDVLQL